LPVTASAGKEEGTLTQKFVTSVPSINQPVFDVVGSQYLPTAAQISDPHVTELKESLLPKAGDALLGSGVGEMAPQTLLISWVMNASFAVPPL